MTSNSPRLGVLQAATVGAATLLVVYLLCWIALAAGWTDASHQYLSIFVTTDPASIASLFLGLLYSAASGAVVGALVAIFMAVFAFLAPRGS